MSDKPNIEISYDGAYPNLCSGNLDVTIDGTEWKFPRYCLTSGGGVSFDGEWNEEVTQGEWSVNDWPNGFPESMKDAVTEEINSTIQQGCCGGCV